MTPLTHQTSGRSRKALIVLAVVWLVVITGWVMLDVATWIVAGLLLLTLPAAYEYATNKSAALTLDDTHLRWHSGGHEGEVALAQIDHVRFDTRLDLSIRVRLVLPTGRRIPVPQDCLPRHPALQEALEARGIKTQRHHFSLM
ncbi:MAG: hypothetical protein QNJ09_09750 [Paracoccaceae bacterium]|nr:hypothetical protein [Paracoccaceae bacterium]